MKNSFDRKMDQLKHEFDQMPVHSERERKKILQQLKYKQKRTIRFVPPMMLASLCLLIFIGAVLVLSQQNVLQNSLLPQAGEKHESAAPKTSADKKSDHSRSDRKAYPGDTYFTLVDEISKSLATGEPMMVPTYSPVSFKDLTIEKRSTDKGFDLYYSESKKAGAAPFAHFSYQQYGSEAACDEAFGYYFDVKNTHKSLGNGILGAVSKENDQLTYFWNEGRWFLQVSGTAGLEPKIDATARDIVAFLSENSLPAPHQYGKITVDVNRSGETLNVSWQERESLYSLKADNSIKALKMAISMKKAGKLSH